MKKCMLFIFIMIMMSLVWAKTYKIVFDAYPPYEYKDDNGTMKGLDIDILKAIAKNENVSFEYILVPWARALSMAEMGDCDAIISLFKNPEREKFLLFPSEGLGYETNVIFANDSFKGDIKTIGDLKGKTIGIVTEYFYGKEFDEYNGYTKEESKDQETLFKKLANNRVSLVITNELVGYYMLKSMNVNNVRKLSYIADNQALNIGVSKKSVNSVELLKLLNKGLNDLKKSGELTKIRNNYKK